MSEIQFSVLRVEVKTRNHSVYRSFSRSLANYTSQLILNYCSFIYFRNTIYLFIHFSFFYFSCFLVVVF